MSIDGANKGQLAGAVAADLALRAEIDRLIDSIHDPCAARGPCITRL